MTEQTNREKALKVLALQNEAAMTEAVAWSLLDLADAVREQTKALYDECHPCQCDRCTKP